VLIDQPDQLCLRWVETFISKSPEVQVRMTVKESCKHARQGIEDRRAASDFLCRTTGLAR
jgi:hypothetical protein